MANITRGRSAYRTGSWGWRRGAGEGMGPATETGKGTRAWQKWQCLGPGAETLGGAGGASPRATARPDLQGPGATRNTVISHRQKTRTTTARKRSSESPRDKAVLCSPPERCVCGSPGSPALLRTSIGAAFVDVSRRSSEPEAHNRSDRYSGAAAGISVPLALRSGKANQHLGCYSDRNYEHVCIGTRDAGRGTPGPSP